METTNEDTTGQSQEEDPSQDGGDGDDPPPSPSGDAIAPSKLIEEHEDLVRSIANRISRRTPTTTPVEDLVAYGFEGLLDAAHKYDEESEAAFTTYAYHRIRGRIIDGYRRQRWGSGKTVQKIEASGLDELDSSRDVTPRGRTVIEPRSEETVCAGTDRKEMEVVLLRSREVSRIGQRGKSDQREHLENKETRERLREAIEILGETEREVVERCDLRDESMADVADDLGCSKSWVSRLRSRALDKLRRYLEHERSHAA